MKVSEREHEDIIEKEEAQNKSTNEGAQKEYDLFSLQNDYLSKQECTTFFFGSTPMVQQLYECTKCIRKKRLKLCHFCFHNCHKDCNKSTENDSEDKEAKINAGKFEEFACECGLKLKHKIPKKVFLAPVKCEMYQLDKILKAPFFYCETHKISVCCICYSKCHVNCKTSMNDNKNGDENYECNCKTMNHTGYSEGVLSFHLDDYKTVAGVAVWPVQVFNILFSQTEQFNKLYELFIKTIKEPNSKIEEHFYPLIELFSTTFNRKFKTYYYDEKLLSMLNFNDAVQFVSELQTIDDKTSTAKFRIIFIILFLYVKTDFDMHKCLTSKDFLSLPIIPRLKYKKMIKMECKMNEKILERYINENSFIIKIVTNEIGLLESSLNYLSLNDSQEEFEIGLKFICFVLKHMMLDNEQLEKLVETIFNLFNKFYEAISESRANIYPLLNVFSCLAEILIELAVTYNDSIIDDYFSTGDIGPFIHKDNHTGEMIFHMLLKSCDVLKFHYELLLKSDIYSKDYEDQKFKKKLDKHKDRMFNKKNSFLSAGKSLMKDKELLPEKIIIIFQEALNLFCLADNDYKKRMDSIEKEELIDYNLFKEEINNNTFGNFFTVYGRGGNGESNQLYEFKANIEEFLHTLFDRKEKEINITQKTSDLIDIIERFCKETTEIFNDLSNRNDINLNENLLKKNSNISESNLNTFRDKMIVDLEKHFEFVKEDKFKNETIRNNFIDSLCLYSLDSTLSKLLIFLCNKRFVKMMNIELFNKILSFFRFFLLNKRGIEFFILGKNITRLQKLFKKFQCTKKGNTNGNSFETNLKYTEIILYFLVHLGKSMKFQKIKLRFHVPLFRLQRCILEHLEELNLIKDSKNELSLKRNYCLSLKFFDLYSEHFEYEDFQEIKRKIIFNFGNSGYCNLNENLLKQILKRETVLGDNNSNLISSTALYHSNTNLCSEFNSNYEENKIDGVELLEGEEEQEVEFNNPKKNNIERNRSLNSSGQKNNKKETAIQTNTNKNKLDTGGEVKSNDKSKIVNSTLITLKEEINVKLYFALLKIIIKETYYVYKGSQEEKLINKLIQTNPINKFKNIFNNKDHKCIYIKERTLLLSFLRVIHLIEHLDRIDLFKKDFSMTNKEYKSLLYSKEIKVNGLENIQSKSKVKLSKEEIDNLKEKYTRVNDIEALLDIYIQEISKFPKQCDDEDDKYIDSYIKEIIFGIKQISDFFFLNPNIINQLVVKFYILTIKFLEKSKLMISMLKDFKENGEVMGVYEKLEDNKIIDKLRDINTNVYDIPYLYSIVTEEIYEIFEKTKINEGYSLQNYLDIFDNTNESNFTPFALVETYDYEYFYQSDSDKAEEEALKNKYSKILIMLQKEYVEQFVDISNTNYYLVLTNISNENIRLDYRQKIINYFIAFFCSTDSYQIYKLSPLLCIINKLMFYDGDEMQPRFSKINRDKFFFQIFNYKLHQLLILSIISSRNPLDFEQSMKNINLCKLFIQFLQLLGEGFNLDYHDNIFRLQREVIKYLRFYATNISSKKLKNEEEDDFIEDEDLIDENTNIIQNEINNSQSIESKDKIVSYKDEQNYISILKETVYKLLILTLKKAFYLVNIGFVVEGELPYDKLIVLMTNIIDFLIEFKETTEENNNELVTYAMELFFGKRGPEADTYYGNLMKKGILKDAIFTSGIWEKKGTINNVANINENDGNEEIKEKKYSLRKKLICYIKLKFVDLVNNYLYLNNHPRIYEKLKSKQFSSLKIFNEILIHFKEMIMAIKDKEELTIFNKLVKIQTDEQFVKYLIKLYVESDIFNDLIEFPLVLKMYILIKIYQEFYGESLLINHFNKISNVEYKQKVTLDKEENTSIDSYFAKRVYSFLEQLVLRAEIKVTDANEDNEEEGQSQQMIKSEDVKDISKQIYLEICPHKTSKFSQKKIEKTSGKNSETNVTFFVRPSLTFRLSEQSKINFENNVDRDNATDKYLGLIKFSDYSLLEIIVNQHLVGSNWFKKLLSNIPYDIAEYINYIFIFVQNILIMIHFYRGPNTKFEVYDVVKENAVTAKFPSNLVIAIIQTVFTGLILINWFFFKFLLTFQHNLMDIYDINFVFKKKGDDDPTPAIIVDYFKDMDLSTFSILREKNKELSVFQLIIVAVFPSLLFNSEINMFVYTFILSILYIRFGISLFLIIPILFVANISETLGNIFIALKQNIKHMLLIIVFILLINYIYAWFSYYFLDYFFDFEEVMEYDSGQFVKEPFCKSVFQCFLYITQYGLKAGGGVGETLSKVSFKESPGVFVLRFFYDLLFFSLIILILFNIFVGIIVGAFAQIRDETYMVENDKNNVCFICQLTRDDCLQENIDFDNHVEKDHNIWNYVYFLTNLHINDPNNFNSTENSVWKKLEEQDITWIPIKSDAE